MPVPAIADQKEFAKQDDNLAYAEEDDDWYIIDMAWLTLWKEYVDWNGTGKSSGKCPGPIDNTALVERGQRLKNPHGLGVDFDVISDSVHAGLVRWYGVVEGSPVLKRPVVFNGGANIVEVSAPVFDIWEMNAETGASGRPVPGNVQVVVSRKQNAMYLFLAAVEAWMTAKGLPEPDEDWVKDRVRFWYSLDVPAGSEDGEASDENKAPQWHFLDWTSDTLLTQVQIGDDALVYARAPRVLLETRESGDAPWVLEGPEQPNRGLDAFLSPESFNVPHAAGASVETKECKEAAGGAPTVDDKEAEEAASRRAEVRKRVLEMDEDEWRAALDVGSEVDCFDGKQWQESTVVSVGQPSSDSVAIHFRSQPGHVLETVRTAGQGLAADDKPVAGSIAKPYTHVSDWRTQLRQDMKIQVFVKGQPHYRCDEAESTLHYIPRYKEWWVSDHEVAARHERVGYINVVSGSERPPTSDEKLWELWANAPSDVWQDSPHVKVTLEGTPGQEDIRFCTDESTLKEHHPGFRGNAQKINGLFKKQPGGAWETRKVVKVNYKTRKITITNRAPYSYGYSYYSSHSYYGTTTMSLDDDNIRELLFADHDDDAETGDTAEIGLKLATGVAGLRNMGNTCFMNSVLQSLFALTSFVGRFADAAAVEKAINKNNFLGTGGKLARAFSALVRKYAARTGGVVERDGQLSAFKATLGNFAPVFAGFQQQDAMEFFNQFTSFIHEDLNRIKKKPYVEDLDDDGKASDSEMADESWRRFKLREDSMIVDLFQGQFRSHLTCPETGCGYESRRFDPFTAVACPLPKPEKKKKRKKIRFYSCAAIAGGVAESEECSSESKTNSSDSPPPCFTMVVECAFQGAAVAAEFSSVTGIPKERILVVESFHSKIYRVIFDAASNVNGTFVQRDCVLAFEIPEGFDPKVQLLLEVQLLQDTPLLWPITRDENTAHRDVAASVAELLKKRLISSPSDLDSDDVNVPDFEDGDEVEWDGGGQDKSGVIHYMRIGYSGDPTKAVINVNGDSDTRISKLPENLTHTKDFKQLAIDYLNASPTASPEVWSLAYTDAESYSYLKSKETSPWKKPKASRYDERPLEDSDKKCPNIASVRVCWERDYKTLINKDFDSGLIQPKVWEKERPVTDQEPPKKPEPLTLRNSLRVRSVVSVEFAGRWCLLCWYTHTNTAVSSCRRT